MRKIVLPLMLFACLVFVFSGCGGSGGKGSSSTGNVNIVDGKSVRFSGAYNFDENKHVSIFEAGKTYTLISVVSYWDTDEEITDYDKSGAVWIVTPSSAGNFSGSSSYVGATASFTAGAAGQKGQLKIEIGTMWYFENFEVV